MVRLHVTPAEGAPFEHAVGADALVIGRSSTCDLSTPDRFLSRRHARLYRKDDTWLIEDLGSRNGTFVNGRRIDGPQAVRPGDVLTMSASRVEMAGDGVSDSVSTDARLRPASEVLLKTATPPPAGDGTGSLALRRYADRLAIINEVHHALAGPITLDELLDLILDRVFEHLRPEHGAIFLKKERGGYERAAGRSVPNAAGELVCSERLVEEVANKGMAALVLDAQTDQRFAGAASMLNAGVQSLIAAPATRSEGSARFHGALLERGGARVRGRRPRAPGHPGVGGHDRTLETALRPGDLLVLYTDGYTEALNPQSEEFGSNRLADSCAALQGEALEVIARGLEREVDAFCGASPATDDRTLVMVRRKVGGGS